MWETILYTSIVLISMIILSIFVVYLINFKNLQKQKIHFEQIHKNCKVGTKVEVLNGIYGEISAISEDLIELKIMKGGILEVSRYAITKIIQ